MFLRLHHGFVLFSVRSFVLLKREDCLLFVICRLSWRLWLCVLVLFNQAQADIVMKHCLLSLLVVWALLDGERELVDCILEISSLETFCSQSFGFEGFLQVLLDKVFFFTLFTLLFTLSLLLILFFLVIR